MEKVLFNGQASEKAKLMEHVAHCPTCKQMYDELQQEQTVWEQALYRDELPIDFTDHVMSQINMLEVEASSSGNALWTATDSSKSTNVGLRKMRSSLFKMKVASAVLAVIVMLLAISMFVQPSLAEKIRSMFTKSSLEWLDVVDPGLKSAKELVSEPKFTAKNGDYTFEVKEMYADPLRILISGVLKDKVGNEVKGHSLEIVSLEVRDNHRHIIPGRLYGLNMEELGAIPFYGMVFKEPVMTDDISIKMVLKDSQDNNKKGEHQTIPGQWTIYCYADIRKAKEKTIIAPVSEQYTTPSGLNIKMNGIAYAPSGLGLSFNTMFTKEAQQRSPGELDKMSGIYYHYEKNGEPWDGYSDFYDESDIYYDPWQKETKWYTFDSRLTVANKTDDIKFVLDGYMTTEHSDEKITFMPSKISESKPAVFDSLGDSFNITSVEYFEKHKSYGDKQTLINISNGVFTNTMTDDQWEVIDENGKTYRADFSVQGRGQDVRFGKPSYFSSGHIIVDKLTHIPTQLTLRRKIVGRLYKDVNWSFMLPKEGKVLESNIINRDHLRSY
ncbi:hypothetical protein J2Z32_000256 [Paenibacillus turicensis]|uniref:DUF4179 domain-containing protein n=1 Tax=Paenibacillus turicensis TaxID=160487 RepID=A0ABS4FMQ1_9BACL|nr:DUF4179 domain-containing protein [Paenibacillus turicensis]MBP1903644.1 hypothetical protein [Paenibacillus turicensis]